MQTITEVTSDEVFDSIRIDRDKAVIRDVTLLSPVSKNGRKYAESSINDAVRLYDGARYYVDHPTDRQEKETQGVRSVHDLAGKVVNVRTEGTFPDIKVRGDLQLLKGLPITESILAIAEQMPGVAGNSHRVLASTRKTVDGQEVVERIDRVMGMELVTDPATTSGLFESATTPTDDDLQKEDDETMDLVKLKADHPDLVKAILAEQKEDLDQSTKIKEQDDKIVALTAKLKEFEDKESATVRDKMITEKIKSAKLPDHAVTDTFKALLEKAADEKEIDALIEDRKAISGTSKVKHPENDLSGKINEGKTKPVDGSTIEAVALEMFS